MLFAVNCVIRFTNNKKIDCSHIEVRSFLFPPNLALDMSMCMIRIDDQARLNQYIEVFPAVKEDGVTNQRVTIHYNCIGAFEVPDRRKIPERDILLKTRKGVALSYAPTQSAI